MPQIFIGLFVIAFCGAAARHEKAQEEKEQRQAETAAFIKDLRQMAKENPPDPFKY